jgi:hypothetical protein
MDVNGPQFHESWVTFNVVPFDPNQVAANLYNMDDIGYTANWLLRADTAAGDCNGNGRPDFCDVPPPLGNCVGEDCSQDCQPNGVPDECEPDCNGNGQPDDCDIASGSSLDCNGNGVPDECDIADGTSQDCNGNTVPDECDIANGTSLDCQPNGIPDECDIANCNHELWCADCQPDGIPDGCQLSTTKGPGDVLISQLPNQTNGIFSDCQCVLCGQPQVLADDFIIDADGTPIGTVNVWGGNYPGDSTPTNNWHLEFYLDAGGFPGASVYSYLGTATMQQTGVVLFGVHEWLITIVLPDPNPLFSAGRYWVTLYADDPGDDWFWEAGNLDSVHGITGNDWGLTCPPTYPNTEAGDLAFELLEGTSGPLANDCNGNHIPDECDIGTQWGGYCVGPDCDSDWNSNGIPDGCELCGDFTDHATPPGPPDGFVDVYDYWYFLDAFGTCVGDPKYKAAADMDGDGCITLVDYQAWRMCYKMANGHDFVAPKPKPKPVPVPVQNLSKPVINR